MAPVEEDMAAKRKKVASPTGRPSKVHPDLDAAMKGKGGKRPTAKRKAKPKAKPKGKSGSKNVTAGGMVKGKRARDKYLDEI